MRQRCSRFALIGLGILVLLLHSAVSVPAHAQDADFKLGRAPISSVVSADCTPMAVTRLTAEPNEELLSTLSGNVHPLARAEFDRGAVPDSLPMEHMIMMLQRTPDQELALQARIDQMHNHQSPLFHKWLSSEQVGSCYGAADADIATISKWLQGKGFKVDSVPAGKTMLIFSGTAGLVREAFHTEMHYLNVSGEQHIANMSAPQIPAAFAPVVAGFRSLHDFFPKPTVRPIGLVRHDPKTGKDHLANGKESSPLQKLASKSKGRPDVDFADLGDQDVGPQDFYTIYNENPLLNGTSCNGAACNGAGQSIGVIEETDVCAGQSGTSPDDCAGANDLAAFRSQFGLPAANVHYMFGIPSYCGDPGVLGPNGTDEEGEADLDVQWAGAVAPGAALYFIACASTESSAGIDLAATYAVNNMASTLSSFSESYGACESQLGSYTSFYNALWEQAAAQGQTVVISAGDSGDDTCDRDAIAATSGWNVNGLASTPYNVVAGGTDFSDYYSSGPQDLTAGGPYWNSNDTAPYGSALSYIPETTWNGTCASTLVTNYISAIFSTLYTPEEICNGENGIFGTLFTTVGPAGGGGISSVYSIPTWQSVYGAGLSTNYSSSTMRNLPDVSLFASNGVWNRGLLFCESDSIVQTGPTTFVGTGSGGGIPCDYSNSSDGGLMAAGGTSFVAPQINGLMAVVNQAHPSGNPAQPSRQGQADYTLYALAAYEYGTPGAENVSTTAPSVLTCESNYLAMAQYSSVFPSCVFYNINRTPLLGLQECSGTDSTSCIVDGNQMPCVTGDTDCYTATGGDAYGVLSISTSSFEPAWSQSAGYSDATGLGSVNIANLVANWNSSTWITQYNSTTALATSASSISPTGSVILTATVTATGRGSTVSPAGVVEFFIGSTSGTLLGNGPIVQTCTGSGTSTSCNGVATLNLAGSALNIGGNSIIAYFEGDGANDAPSTSTAQTVTVTTSPAILTSPTPGLSTILGSSGVVFSWTNGMGVSEYELTLGTVAGAQDLFTYKGTATSATASTIPANGAEVYATLYSKIGGVWQSSAYVYTESG
ncbi:MAG: protease pro-enzyme activation domain-containing protein, partial [Terracidiphilus sp.]